MKAVAILVSLARAAAVVVLLGAGLSRGAGPEKAARADVPESELLLSFSVELSNEPDNASTVAARAVRTHWWRPGDESEAAARIGNLRKEMLARYVTPVTVASFSVASHEARAAEIRQFLDADRIYGYREATYRNLWTSASAPVLWGAGWGIEGVRLDAPEGVAPFLTEYVARQGRTTTGVPLIAFIARDRRLPGKVVPEGHATSVIAEWGTPAGTIEYARIDASHHSYFPLASGLAAGFGVSLGRLVGLDGDLSPYGKRYLGGGVGSVRGYEAGSLSPVDASGAATGADKKATVSAEALWHAFTVGGTPIVASAFADWGRFAGSSQAVVGSATASSVGLGITVPLRGGLIRAYFTRALDKQYRAQSIQFEARATW